MSVGDIYGRSLVDKTQAAAALLIAARVALGLFFVPSAIAKLLDPQGFAAGVRDYRLLPRRVSSLVARLVPWAELAVGLALWSGVAPTIGGAAAAFLIALFLVAMATAMARGLHIDCNCYGIAATRDIGRSTLARDGLLLLLSLMVVACGAISTGGWFPPLAAAWVPVSSLNGALLAGLLTVWCVAVVYLVEWGLDVAERARSLTRNPNRGLG